MSKELVFISASLPEADSPRNFFWEEAPLVEIYIEREKEFAHFVCRQHLTTKESTLRRSSGQCSRTFRRHRPGPGRRIISLRGQRLFFFPENLEDYNDPRSILTDTPPAPQRICPRPLAARPSIRAPAAPAKPLHAQTHPP